jgi:hypothetical protein
MIVGRTVVRRPERSERPSSRPGDPAPRSEFRLLRSATRTHPDRHGPPGALSAMLAGRSRSGAGRQDTASILPAVPQPRRASTASGAVPAVGSAAKAAPPASRALSKTAMLRKSASTPNVMGLASVKEEERPLGLASPPPPSRAETSASPSKRGGNHTPGRRGEKRARPSSAASGSGGMLQARIKRERSASIFSPATDTFDLPSVSGASSDVPDGAKAVNAIEQRNKAAVKKLVHHQLLGRGYEKRDEAYLACYNVTCAGTCTALVSPSRRWPCIPALTQRCRGTTCICGPSTARTRPASSLRIWPCIWHRSLRLSYPLRLCRGHRRLLSQLQRTRATSPFRLRRSRQQPARRATSPPSPCHRAPCYCISFDPLTQAAPPSALDTSRSPPWCPL